MIKYVDKLYKFYKNFKFSYVLIFNRMLVFAIYWLVLYNCTQYGGPR